MNVVSRLQNEPLEVRSFIAGVARPYGLFSDKTSEPGLRDGVAEVVVDVSTSQGPFD